MKVNTLWTQKEGGGGPEIGVRRLVGDKHTGVQELRRTPTSSSTPPTELLLRGDTHHHMTLILRSKVHGVHPQAAGVDEAILSAEVSSYQCLSEGQRSEVKHRSVLYQ
ncbi:hypothetical protein PAMP_011538 [Pampus punctatissimus]